MLPGSVAFTETVASGLLSAGTRVTGFPRLEGFQSGRFLEWYAEVSLPVRDCFRLGSFVRYNVAQASATVQSLSRLSTNAVTGAIVEPTFPSVDYDFNFDRRVWSVGGVVAFSF